MSNIDNARSLVEDMQGKTIESVVIGGEHPSFTRTYQKITVTFDDGSQLVFYPAGDYIQVP
jgi:hypothetical protein